MTKPAARRYHHGDLKAALLRAAEAELAAHGAEGFSLRAVAKRAGVSHAAPAHHFGDVGGLLSALVSIGYQRLIDAQLARQAAAPPDPRSRMIESGVGYVDFALANPALFRLMFNARFPEDVDPALTETSRAAFGMLVENVAAVTGADPETDRGARRYLLSVWSLVHGLAHLLIADRPFFMADLSPAAREAEVRAAIAAMAGTGAAAAAGAT